MQKRFQTADPHSVTNKLYESNQLKNLVNVMQVVVMLFVFKTSKVHKQ